MIKPTNAGLFLIAIIAARVATFLYTFLAEFLATLWWLSSMPFLAILRQVAVLSCLACLSFLPTRFLFAILGEASAVVGMAIAILGIVTTLLEGGSFQELPGMQITLLFTFIGWALLIYGRRRASS